MRHSSIIFLSFFLFLINSQINIHAKPYDAILRFLQKDEPEDSYEEEDDNSYEDEEEEQGQDNNHEYEEDEEDHEHKPLKKVNEVKKEERVDSTVVKEPDKTPSWVDEDDLVAEFESSQNERANDLSIKALQKRRAANSLRVYCEGIQDELEKAKKRTNGLKKLDTYKLTSQLEANLARASLLYKQADLLDEKAKEAKKSLELLHSNDRDKLLLRDCNILKIGPLSYSSRGDNIIHKFKEPLMAKLTGNSLVLYHNKLPQLTYYMVDVEMPTKPVESALRCLSFGYRGADQVLCASTEQSAYSWMNAISEAWFCKHMGIKGTLVNLDNVKANVDEQKSRLKHAVKEKNKDKGLINMEVFVDDDNKTHLLVEGKEKPLSSISDIIDVNQIVLDKKSKKEKEKRKNKD